MFDRADGFGVRQSMLAHRAGTDIDSIVLTHSFDRATKGFLRTEVGQGPLQGQ